PGNHLSFERVKLVAGEMGSRSYNPMLRSMIQDAILKLCTQNMIFSKSLEIDGIICVSQGEELPDLVVKMHRTIVKPPSKGETWTGCYTDASQVLAYPPTNTTSHLDTSYRGSDVSLSPTSKDQNGGAKLWKGNTFTTDHDPTQVQHKAYEQTLPEATQVTPGDKVGNHHENSNVKSQQFSSGRKRSRDINEARNEGPPEKQLIRNIKEEPITLDLNDDDNNTGEYGDDKEDDIGDISTITGATSNPDDTTDNAENFVTKEKQDTEDSAMMKRELLKLKANYSEALAKLARVSEGIGSVEPVQPHEVLSRPNEGILDPVIAANHGMIELVPHSCIYIYPKTSHKLSTLNNGEQGARTLMNALFTKEERINGTTADNSANYSQLDPIKIQAIVDFCQANYMEKTKISHLRKTISNKCTSERDYDRKSRKK
ncbi:unnamed protein product, partial [Owenia fusiformis]